MIIACFVQINKPKFLEILQAFIGIIKNCEVFGLCPACKCFCHIFMEPDRMHEILGSETKDLITRDSAGSIIVCICSHCSSGTIGIASNGLHDCYICSSVLHRWGTLGSGNSINLLHTLHQRKILSLLSWVANKSSLF